MSNKSYMRIQDKLNKMGVYISASIFIYMRLASCIILFILTYFQSSYGYIIAPLTTIIYYILIEYIILDLGIKRQKELLESESLSFFPLFLIHLKGTRNVKKALSFTTTLFNNNLSKEFAKVIKKVDLGASLEDSLLDMKSKMPSENISNIITTIIEVNRVGINSEESINYQLESIRNNKEHLLISYLKKIPLKIALVSICFVFIMLTILIFLKLYLI